MKQRTSRRGLIAGAAGAMTTALAGCASMTPFVGQRLTDTMTEDAGSVESISVIGNVGAINIAGSERDDIRIDVVKQSSSVRADLEALTVETARENGQLDIWTEYHRDLGWMESEPSADLTIRIPDDIAVNRIESTVGGVEIQQVPGDMSVETTTGRITINDVDGSVSTRSTTGRIEISGVTGRVSANATTGRVTVHDIGIAGDLTTTTGRISVDIPAIKSDTDIRTQTGRITAAIAPTIDAEISAASTTGRISHDNLPLTDVSTGPQSLRGTLGDGGPRINLQSSTGRITLRPLD